jgi:hypothetical protein
MDVLRQRCVRGTLFSSFLLARNTTIIGKNLETKGISDEHLLDLFI